jgi:hypothetical protein
MNYNNFKEKLPTFFPWGMLFLLSVSLIVLPALSCRKEKTEQAQTSKPAKLGRRGKWFSKKQRSVKSKKAPPATTEWSILN